MSTVGERDFSVQETCHLLLMLLMITASRDFLVLSLDGSRQVYDNLDKDRPVTVDSQRTTTVFDQTPRISTHHAGIYP